MSRLRRRSWCAGGRVMAFLHRHPDRVLPSGRRHAVARAVCALLHPDRPADLGRFWVSSMEDRRRARCLFGRVVVAASALALYWRWLFAHDHNLGPDPLLPTLPGVVIGLEGCPLASVYAIFRRSIGLAQSHRAATNLLAVLMVLTLPALSRLGRPYEQLIMLAALLAGDAVGYASELRSRHRFLQRRVHTHDTPWP